MQEDQEITHTFVVDNDSEKRNVSYKIRGLKEEEVPAWSEFCASVFAYKANPPPASYFERHYTNDPFRDKASLIRVAFVVVVDEDGEEEEIMVASCRLFLRDISNVNGNGNVVVKAAGIGEVCTASSHRKRGLSKVLLQNCIAIMKERKCQISLLHAAPSFFPVYEKAGGYRCSTSHWSAIAILTTKLLSLSSSSMSLTTTAGPKCSIRQAIFPQDTDRLFQLHQVYSEQRFAGCIVRTKEYWNNYLSQEMKGSLWVLEKMEENDEQHANNNGSNTKNNIISWLSIRARGSGRFQLREFGMEEKEERSEGVTPFMARAFFQLLAQAMRSQEGSDDPSSSSAAASFTLSLPTSILDQIRNNNEPSARSCVDWTSETSEDDLGWMYKILDPNLSLETFDGSQAPHLIWPSDSF